MKLFIRNNFLTIKANKQDFSDLIDYFSKIKKKHIRKFFDVQIVTFDNIRVEIKTDNCEYIIQTNFHCYWCSYKDKVTYENFTDSSYYFSEIKDIIECISCIVGYKCFRFKRVKKAIDKTVCTKLIKSLQDYRFYDFSYKDTMLENLKQIVIYN